MFQINMWNMYETIEKMLVENGEHDLQIHSIPIKTQIKANFKKL